MSVWPVGEYLAQHGLGLRVLALEEHHLAQGVACPQGVGLLGSADPRRVGNHVGVASLCFDGSSPQADDQGQDVTRAQCCGMVLALDELQVGDQFPDQALRLGILVLVGERPGEAPAGGQGRGMVGAEDLFPVGEQVSLQLLGLGAAALQSLGSS